MTTEWVTHKGKKILVSTYSNLNPAAMIKVIEKQADIVKNSSNKVLLLDDFTDSHGASEFMDRAKELGKQIITAKTEKNAIIGVQGVKKILFRAYVTFTGANIKVFDKKADALNWLAE